MLDFSKSIFETTYSFESGRKIVRILSDAFSREFCDYKSAAKYAAMKTKGRCIFCGRPMYFLSSEKVPVFTNSIHYDHLYPASKMNLFEVGNVAIACEVCNLAKSDRLPMEYYDIRANEGVSLYIHDREEFEKFIHDFSKPYREKWPEHYATGTRVIEDDKEYKELIIKLLLEPTNISASSSKYNHENSVNKEIWEKVVQKAIDTFSETTAKDVSGRIGYTNAMFEDTYGHDRLLQDTTISELHDFANKLLMSKYESKNEFQKFRMLIKLLTEVLNDGLLSGQLEGFFANIPTYAKVGKEED